MTVYLIYETPYANDYMEEYNSFSEKIFDSEEKAQNYLKNLFEDSEDEFKKHVYIFTNNTLYDIATYKYDNNSQVKHEMYYIKKMEVE